jgi:hypothetical protein
MEPFVYYNLKIRLRTEMLGTCTQASIYDTHVLKKAQKMIKEANKMSGKVTKALAKYQGTEIKPEKEREELAGIVRRYQELLGKKDPLPDDVESLLEFVCELEDELDAAVESKDQKAATVFMRNEEGMPMISSHMILGNLKENLKIITNNTTLPKEAKPIKSKVQVGETLTLDVKCVEEFIHPTEDVVRDDAGKPDLLERPIKFERMGRTETAIAMSERLPPGTEMECHLRIRADSPFAADDAELVRYLLKLGKSNGLGQWRGSGGKGQFDYKLERVEGDPTAAADGWD